MTGAQRELLEVRPEVHALLADRGQAPTVYELEHGRQDEGDHRQKQHRGLRAGCHPIEVLLLAPEATDERRCSEHEQDVAYDRAHD